ncbi:MAG: DUF5666 domain-containing protein [Dehalococcoidia bacterium]|nr:DUF5666 domain-containing protein [Dehalococcoidia bacterium]
MRIRSFSAVLDECLTAMRHGESAEACLARYPRHAERLRPLLTLAGRIARTPTAGPRPWAQATAWDRVRQRAAHLRSGHRRPLSPPRGGSWLRPLAVTLALFLAVIAGGGATALAAQDSLPDSPLYRVKLATEEVRLWFIFDDSRKAEVLLDQSDERVDEILAMVQQGKPVPANVLDSLRDRDERAANILRDRPEETALRARILTRAEAQERLLIDLWPQVSESARDEYTEAVALIHNTRLQNSGNFVLRPEDLSGGVLSISGIAEPAGEGVWKVGGVEVRIDERTIGHQDVQQGATAKLVVGRSTNGRLYGLSLSTVQTDLPPTGGTITGIVEEVTDKGIRMAGQFITFDSDTIKKLDIKPGKNVDIVLDNTANGIVAKSVAPAAATADSRPPLTFEGTLEGDISGSVQWTVAGHEFKITPDMKLLGNVSQGARVQVEAVSDGNDLLAQRLTVLASTEPATSLHIIGTFQETDDDGLWLISGLPVVPPGNAQDPEPGSIVAIEAIRQGGDTLVSQFNVVQTPGQTDVVRFHGTITSIEGSLWTLDIGWKVRVTSTADASGGRATAGVRVLGWGQRGPDGTLQGKYVRILDQRPVISTPTPTPEQ